MDLREYLMMMGGEFYFLKKQPSIHSIHTLKNKKYHLSIIYLVTHGGTIEQKLKASFEMFDKDGNGELSKVEVREMFMLIVNQVFICFF